MRKLWLVAGAVATLALGLCGPPHFGAVPAGAQVATPNPPCGTPFWTPSPGASVNASTLGGELMHLETCAASAAAATSAPQATPTSANLNCSFASYVMTCTTPTPLPSPTATATGCGTLSWSGLTLAGNTASCFGSSGNVTAPTFKAAAESIVNVTHFWTFNTAPGGATPGPCPSSASVPDDIANGATALPSPVPITGTHSTIMYCGMPPVLADGGTAILFCTDQGTGANGCSNSTTSNYFTLPLSVLPASVAAPGFSVGFVYADSASASGNAETLFGLNTTDDLQLYSSANCNPCQVRTRVSGSENPSTFTDRRGHLLIYTWDGTSSKTYNDCNLGYTNTTGPTAPTVNGAIGSQLNVGPTDNFAGRIEYAFLANTALSYAQVATLCVSTKLNEL